MALRLSSVRDRPALNVALLLLTIATTFLTFQKMLDGGAGSYSRAATFSLALILILGAHEMGHYILARMHGVDTSLPYFIPLPFLGVGTLGAVIRIRSRIPDRNALVDIGAAGPLAGLAFAIPVLAIGFANSHFVDAPTEVSTFPGATSLWALFGELARYLGSKFLGLPWPDVEIPSRGFVTVFGDNLLSVALRRLIMGPLPVGKDVLAHPAVIAGWFGLLVTMLNLIPIGQLDGGHLSFAMFGERARTIGKWMALGMLVLCLFASSGWLLWLLITTKLIGFRHPEVVEPVAPLSLSRRIVCWTCFIALVLCIMPIPISMVSIP